MFNSTSDIPSLGPALFSRIIAGRRIFNNAKIEHLPQRAIVSLVLSVFLVSMSAIATANFLFAGDDVGRPMFLGSWRPDADRLICTQRRTNSYQTLRITKSTTANLSNLPCQHKSFQFFYIRYALIPLFIQIGTNPSKHLTYLGSILLVKQNHVVQGDRRWAWAKPQGSEVMLLRFSEHTAKGQALRASEC